MSVLSWIVLGLLVGFFASMYLNKSGHGRILDLVMGMVGAVVGGGLATLYASDTGFNFQTLFAAFIAAGLTLVAYHAFSGRGAH